MAQKESAGLLLYRRRNGSVEVLLAHPGGPYWATRHEGAWTIPKGGIHPGEDPLQTAIREFKEETGFDPCGPYLSLGQITQRSGKIVHAYAPFCAGTRTSCRHWCGARWLRNCGPG